MKIEKAIDLLKALQLQTDKKKEKRVYDCFVQTLLSLKNKQLTENQLQLVQKKLSGLNLTAITSDNKKYYTQKLSEFKVFLKNEFSFTKENYYSELGMVYGICIGTALGMSIGVVFDPVLGVSIGLSIGTGVGMVMGMIYGAQKDTKIKQLGKHI